ncbi:MAG TPA: cytochrome ubiquinol oxidase subunit I [Thermomicrobiaceae bacterium]|nr:cytochrome ubiquinol oxidase subunit I [Thermomicrobiaceae bacterium]
MNDAVVISRLQFAFTVTYHYLFPQFTMGMALLILIFKSLGLRSGHEAYNQAARFWTKIFAITFVMGVVTGIPMEFQFGTNWALFSSYAGNVIAQMLAMEGAFAFFLESAFLGLLLFGEKRLGRRGHWAASLLVFIGTWASGFFIVAANAWLQHPVGYTLQQGVMRLSDFWAILFNSWIGPAYLHVMTGAVITATFATAGLGAFYLLRNQHVSYARMFLTVGVTVGLIASVVQLFPTGDWEGRQVASSQPVKLAAMEGQFTTEQGAGITLIGQPDVQNQRLDNAIKIPRVLSFLTYRRWTAQVLGLNAFPQANWPSSIELLYYVYHIMVGLGTIFIPVMAAAAILLWRKTLWAARPMLWILLLAVPFPFIANTAGWFTSEIGRQPWLIYNLLRIPDGASTVVSSGNILFTLIGFAGMYLIMGLLYIVLIVREVGAGPEASESRPRTTAAVVG